MRQSVRIALKVLASALLGVFCIPTLWFACHLFVYWFRIHTSDVYYADYHYATAGLVWFGVGLLILWSSLHGVWRRSFYGSLLVLSAFLGLAAMEIIPNALPRQNSAMADGNYLSDVGSYFRVWYEDHHRFPVNEAEFRDALWKGPAAWQYRVGPAPTSKYKQRGKTLPYEIVVVTDAIAPRITSLSHRPGVVYYCVSGDLQQFWVTMTGLESDVAPIAHIGRIAGISDLEIIVTHGSGRDYPVKSP